jgi:ABC-type dipeptide/oligopeptide/nickel transport system permease component
MIGAYIVFAVIVEYVFGLGGIGSLLVGATLTQDYPTVMLSVHVGKEVIS